MEPHLLEMEVKKLMCRNANQTIVLMDSNKINRMSLATSVKTRDITHFLTDKDAPDKFITDLESLGVDVTIIDK